MRRYEFKELLFWVVIALILSQCNMVVKAQTLRVVTAYNVGDVSQAPDYISRDMVNAW
jgi:hypothetical protein